MFWLYLYLCFSLAFILLITCYVWRHPNIKARRNPMETWREKLEAFLILIIGSLFWPALVVIWYNEGIKHGKWSLVD